MSPKLSQLLILLTAVTATLQRKLVSDEDGGFNNDGFQNLVQHLKTHLYPGQAGSKAFPGKKRSDVPSLLNIETLNLYVKGDEVKKSQRSGNEQDRMCRIDQGQDKCGCNRRCGCAGNRCDQDSVERDENAVERYGNREEDNEKGRETNEVQQILNELVKELDKDSLRCDERCDDGGRCGCRGRDRTEDRGEEDQLRCRYGRCGRQRNENNLKSQLEQLGRKYKISDDLDAIVVDISNFKGLLGKLNGNLKLDDRNQNKDIDLDYMYGDTKKRESNNGLDAVVLNLDQVKNDEDLVNQVVNELLSTTEQKTEKDDPIRPNELADFFEVKKQRVLGNALNFVTNSRGDKDVSKLSRKQQDQLQKLRSEVQRYGATTNLKEVEAKVTNIVLGDGFKSEVLPHNEKNNNVYIPRWVHSALKVSRDDHRRKRLFPLTNQQKLKMYKQNKKPNFLEPNVRKKRNENGVPFQLQVEGLGQVNP